MVGFRLAHDGNDDDGEDAEDDTHETPDDGVAAFAVCNDACEDCEEDPECDDFHCVFLLCCVLVMLRGLGPEWRLCRACGVRGYMTSPALSA